MVLHGDQMAYLLSSHHKLMKVGEKSQEIEKRSDLSYNSCTLDLALLFFFHLCWRDEAIALWCGSLRKGKGGREGEKDLGTYQISTLWPEKS